jgi:enoyl-CoA hydratase
MADYEFVTYETLDDGRIARIMLNRPEARNAQHGPLLKELDDAFLRAEADDQVRVVILGGHGRSFSSGHDMAFMTRAQAENPDLLPWEAYFGSGRGTSRKGREGHYLAEWHYFFTNTLRWRNLRKVTIAQVQGTVYAAGLMLMWACDLIVGADDANFVDVVGTRLGMCGVEYFAHPWEFGARKTKELMLTGDALTVEEAHRLGMVSKVFPRPDLEERTLEFARRIAALPTVTALLIKESVNQTQDNMGFQNALQACFSLHQLNHGHWAEMAAAGEPRDPALEAWRSSPGVRPAVKDQVAAPVSIR